MKYPRVLFWLIIPFLTFSCNNDNSVAEEKEKVIDESSDQGPNDEDDDQESIISLVNAFPNLSFSEPIDLQAAAGKSNKVYVAERGGVIRVFDNDPTIMESAVFLDFSNSTATVNEGGLLGFAFHPNFESNGYFYIYYTPTPTVSFVSRFTISQANPNLVDENSELALLEIPQPATNHNGGQIAFGADGYLYVATGDGGGSGDSDGNAQNRSNLLGNVLRIDVDNSQGGLNYAIPEDNPFTNETNVRSEIYAYGLRNPWRMSFDTSTGKLWTGDVGQNKIEEIDIIESGKNYGWNLFEGTDCFSGDCNATNLAEPIFEYDQSKGDRSITGGYVYRGSKNPSISGKYIYADFVSGRVWVLDEDGSNNRLLVETGFNIASFGTDANQELYVLDLNGSIYKFQETTN